MIEAEDKIGCWINFQTFWLRGKVGVITREDGRAESWRKACVFTCIAVLKIRLLDTILQLSGEGQERSGQK